MLRFEKAKAEEKKAREQEVLDAVAPMKAELERLKAEEARREQEKKEKRAAKEALKKEQEQRAALVERLVSERLRPIEAELLQLRQQREEALGREGQQIATAAEEKRRREVEAEAEKKRRDAKAAQEAAEEAAEDAAEEAAEETRKKEAEDMQKKVRRIFGSVPK